MANILVVEDDRDSCESLARFLSAVGHTVSCEEDGRAALKTLFKTDPDLIILDLRLPVMDGLAFLKVIRSYVRFQSHPVLITTGVDDSVTLSEAECFGVKHVFKKGHFEFGQLRKAIDAALPQKPN